MTKYQGDLPEAHRLLAESISIGREVGEAGKRNLAHALTTLGHATLLQGDPTTARELAGEGLRLFQEVGEAWGTALALFYLGKAMVELGDLVAARSLLEESAALFRVVGDRQRLTFPLNALGLVALGQGDYAGANAHFEEALAVAGEMEDEKSIAEALAHLGTVALRVGDYPQAAALYQQSLVLIWARGYTENIAEDLAGLAAVASLLRQSERAARLFGAVEALRKASGIRLSPLRRAENDRTVEGIRAHLDEATFAAAWKEGCTMPLEEVITYALETKDALLTEALPRETNAEEASSILPPGVLSSPPSPPLSPRRVLKQQFGGLTSREREVLRLLATGLTDAQIAEQLVLSLHTVHAHLRTIYSKLGVTSRSAATRYAFEHKLV
jgi:ATP/maltotriose-dependent transcriptional regulator MalT